jgi:protoheme IX farnesyltransferase
MAASASRSSGRAEALATPAGTTFAIERATWREVMSVLVGLVQLTKPGITRTVLVTAWAGAAIAPGPIWNYARLAWALAGTWLIVAAANALNMYLESDVDALMARTRGRPLPSGRLTPETALWFGLVLAFVGIPVLNFCVNGATAFIGVVALLSYVLAYTPMKRLSPFAVWVGAIPGAAPPLMGWTAMTGTLSFGAISLFLLLFVWQIPHFHAIAIFRCAEYRRAGLKVLPVERGLEHTKRTIVALLVLQLAVSALPALAGLGGRAYIVVASISGLLYLCLGLAGLRADAGARWARSLFFASLPYLLVLFGTLMVA